MEQRLIDANALKKEVGATFHGAIGLTVTGAVHEIIDRQPTIDPESLFFTIGKRADDLESLRPRSYWEDVYQTGPCSFSGRCHACGVRNDIPPVEQAYYCPHCGAKMED